MKFLLLASLLTACNFGLVDIEDKPKTCYEITLVVGRDSMHVDSIPYNCGYKRVTTPFDRMLKTQWIIKPVATKRNIAYYKPMAKELTRDENFKRAQAGMREDRNDGIWAQHNHKFGLNSTSFQDLDLGEPYKPSQDKDHNCEEMGCRNGSHYVIKPKWPGRGVYDRYGK